MLRWKHAGGLVVLRAAHSHVMSASLNARCCGRSKIPTGCRLKSISCCASSIMFVACCSTAPRTMPPSPTFSRGPESGISAGLRRGTAGSSASRHRKPCAASGRDVAGRLPRRLRPQRESQRLRQAAGWRDERRSPADPRAVVALTRHGGRSPRDSAPVRKCARLCHLRKRERARPLQAPRPLLLREPCGR